MATTFVDYTGDGNATKAFSFPSIQQSDIKVTVDEVLKSSGTHYNITSYTTTGGGNVVFTAGNIPTSPARIVISRDTNVDVAKATYVAGSSVKAADLNANHEQLLFAAQEEQNVVNSTTTVSGLMSAADKVKLDGIETAATADQTASEIRTLVESASDSNVFTDADHSKLNAIEAGATTDQTASEIRTLVDNASDSNVFTDAEKSKLAGISPGAGATTFANLSDTPANFTGAAGKTLKVNSSGNAVEFVTVTTPAGNFAGLTDTPSSLTGQGGKTVKVNSGGTALEFETVSSEVVSDATPQLGGNLDVQTNEITTSTTNGNIKVTPNGTGVVEIKGAGGADGTLQLNCSANSHGVKIKSPPHSAAQSYTLTLPSNIVNGQFLKTDSNGNLSWAAAGSQTIAINTLSSSGGSGGGSATFNGSATRFTLSNPGSNAQAHLVSINGVIQKPNSGTSPSEGFAIDGNDIIFASAPASGADFFILTIGLAISINTPADDTVTSAKIVDGTIVNGDIADDTITEAKLDIHAAPSGTDKVLGYTSNGMEWVESAAGATGGGTDKIFWENGQTVTTNYTITNGYNAMSAGPVTINNGVAVTIGTGENWTIV
tara:strand:+ start:1827 stop:3635 length:1809 start_codon:yes stop_codon:yes gene_type:complete